MNDWRRALAEYAGQARSDIGPLLAGLALWSAATAAGWAVLRLMRAFFARIRSRLDASRGVDIRPITLKGVELLSRARVVDILETALSVLESLFAVVLGFLYVSLVLAFFPWTKPASRSLLDAAIAALASLSAAALAYLPKLVFVVVVVILVRYLLRLLAFIFRHVEHGTLAFEGFHPEWAEPTFKLLRVIVLIMTLVVVFPYLPGFDSPAFKGVTVVFGLLLSLGSSSAVANIIAGMVLTYMRPFKVGDRVQIAATTGDVVEKSLLVTRVRTIKNEEVTIANSLVLGSHIVNYSASAREEGLTLHTVVTIGYGTPWRQVHELLIAAALDTPGISATPPPYVLQTALNDFFVTYELNAVTGKPAEMARTYGTLHENIQDRFARAGVEIMSPHYSALRSGNASTVPPRG
jgi:small-conductance mechanosensitive channel